MKLDDFTTIAEQIPDDHSGRIEIILSSGQTFSGTWSFIDNNLNIIWIDWVEVFGFSDAPVARRTFIPVSEIVAVTPL